MNATPESFGEMPDGRQVSLFTLTNAHGVVVRVSDLGATLVGVELPDRHGRTAEVTLGFDSAEGYLSEENPYFGATAGRFGNRIADGRFELDGQSHTLAANNEPGGIPCHLHGGVVGFNKVLWHVVANSTPGSIVFEYVSQHGEEGYPGTLTARVSYTLNDANELEWCASATTDQATIVNVVHHPYWNLSGDPATQINDHVLTLAASRYLPTNEGLIPTGELAAVEGTPMDFRQPSEVGAQIDEQTPELLAAGGYDHCWVLDDSKPEGLAFAAKVVDPKSGRAMTLRTNQPAIQFYSGNFLDSTVAGRGGVRYAKRTGLCLETENFPDAPNQSVFPSAVLRPGEPYLHRLVYKFSVE
jgi:aldose 1-epimerase